MPYDTPWRQVDDPQYRDKLRRRQYMREYMRRYRPIQAARERAAEAMQEKGPGSTPPSPAASQKRR